MRIREDNHTTILGGALLLLAAVLLPTHTALAQDGTLDTSFEADGVATVAFNKGGTNFDMATDTVVQPDGKILLTGSAARAGGGEYSVVARLTSAGILDTTFSGDGLVDYSFGSASQSFEAIALQGDKIIAAGYYQVSGQDYDFSVARLNSDGTVDGTFGASGTVTVHFDLGPQKTDVLTDMVVQPDGKIVLVGYVETYYNATDSSQDIAIVRLTADGVYDNSFSTDGKMLAFYDIGGLRNDVPEAVALQPDGKILVAASIDIASDDSDMAVLRINATGGFDTSFGPSNSGGIVVPFNLGSPTYKFDFARDLALMGQKIVVVGEVDVAAGGDRDMGIIRLNADGTLDTSFSIDGKHSVWFDEGGNLYDTAHGVVVQGDGKIVATGSADIGTTDTDFALARLHLNGTADNSFDSDGKTTIRIDMGEDWVDWARAAAVQKDGKILVAGRTDTGSSASDMAVIRVHSTFVLFSDGFETGDTEIWSSQNP